MSKIIDQVKLRHACTEATKTHVPAPNNSEDPSKATLIGKAIGGMSNICNAAKKDVANLLSVVLDEKIEVLDGVSADYDPRLAPGVMITSDDRDKCDVAEGVKCPTVIITHQDSDGDYHYFDSRGNTGYVCLNELEHSHISTDEEIDEFFSILDNFDIENDHLVDVIAKYEKAKED